MLGLIAAAAAALVVGVIAGLVAGFSISKKRMRSAIEEVRGEAVSLGRIAQEKLSEDEPHIDDLLRELNDAVDKTFRAAAALENHEKVVMKKTEGGKEVMSASQQLIRMIDDISGGPVKPHAAPAEPALRARPSTKLTADNLAGAGKKPPVRRLR